jgi:hypothetical protein
MYPELFIKYADTLFNILKRDSPSLLKIMTKRDSSHFLNDLHIPELSTIFFLIVIIMESK